MKVKDIISLVDSSGIIDFGVKNSENLNTYFNHILKDVREENKLFLELGVFTGNTAMMISRAIGKNKFYGFDTFTGLPEDWVTESGDLLMSKSTFATGYGAPHNEDNREFIQGLVEYTLPTFLQKKNLPVKFVHMDLDLYTPTRESLEIIYEWLDEESIVVLDDVYGFHCYEEFAIKALADTFNEEQFEIEPLATCGWKDGWANIALKLKKRII